MYFYGVDCVVIQLNLVIIPWFSCLLFVALKNTALIGMLNNFLSD